MNRTISRRTIAVATTLIAAFASGGVSLHALWVSVAEIVVVGDAAPTQSTPVSDAPELAAASVDDATPPRASETPNSFALAPLELAPIWHQVEAQLESAPLLRAPRPIVPARNLPLLI